MSKYLTALMGASESELSRVIARLEALSGYPSEDIRLAEQTKALLRQKTADLGLDPENTTGPELYHALRLRLLADDARFGRAVGLQAAGSADQANQALVSLARHALPAAKVLALKKTSAKKLLKKHPPARLMKLLGYRSVDSLLKRENVSELFAAAAFTESKRWLAGFWSNHTDLSQSDFEWRKIELIVMPETRWAKASPPPGLVTCMLQLGAAAVWPPSRHKRAGLSVAFLLFEAVEIMRFYSAALQNDQFDAYFGKKMLAKMQQHLHSPVIIEGLPVSWSSLHRHYGRGGGQTSVILEDYLDGDNLHPHRPQELLARLNPSFAWWADSHHVALATDGNPVSLNLGDVLGSVLSPGYNRRQHHNLSSSLWDELLSRYFKYPGVEAHVISQLDSEGQEPETKNINIFNKYSHNLAGQAELA